MKRELNGEFRAEATLEARGETKDTVELSFSSEAPVDRGGFMEILSHDAGDMDLSRLSAGDHPLLLNHDPDRQIGVVTSARIGSDKKGRATVRFSNSTLGREVLDDVKRGIRRLVSVGYRRLREVASEVRNGVEHVRYAWAPFEVSIVPVPADASVGVGRSNGHRLEIRDMSENTESARLADIKAIEQALQGKVEGISDICGRAIAAGTSLADLRADLLKRLPGVVPVAKPSLELDERERNQYSICRAINSMIAAREGRGRFDGFEAEISQEVARLAGRQPTGFFVPGGLLTRADNLVGDVSLGGNLVATNLLAGSFIEALRNKTFVMALGGRVLDGLVGNVTVPRHSGAVQAYWVTSEAAAATQSNSVFDQVTLTPKCVTGYEVYSKQLLAMSTPSIDFLVRDDLMASIAMAIDLAALHGSGSNGEPQGIAGNAGATITCSAAGAIPTYSDIIDLESAVATNNADTGSLAFLTNASVRGALRKQLKTTVSAGAGFIWESENGRGKMLDYRAEVSNQVLANQTIGTLTTVCSSIFYSNWSDLLIGQWAGVDIVTDIFSLADTRRVRVLAHQFCDIAPRHKESFAVILDALTS